MNYMRNGHLKNLQIISISLDTDKKQWLNAIKQDSLFWKTHFCDLSGGNSAQLRPLHIGSIPYSYLINRKGIIMAVNPVPGQIENLLADH